MATPASSEAIEIRRRGRRRLIGVIAIVALLVVFVPMIFDSQPRTGRNDPAMAIPTKENPPPLPPPSPARSSPAPAKSEPAAPAKSEPAAPAPSAVQPAPAPSKEPPAVARVTPEKASAAAPKLEGFAVQVGAFRDEAKLRQAREKLAAAGVPHYTERLDNASGELTRLRAGPFPTRAAAEAALAKVHGTKLDGQVVALP